MSYPTERLATSLAHGHSSFTTIKVLLNSILLLKFVRSANNQQKKFIMMMYGWLIMFSEVKGKFAGFQRETEL
jgi:hypothetical protein